MLRVWESVKSIYKAGIKSVPVVYDLDEIVTAETGQMYYRNDI